MTTRDRRERHLEVVRRRRGARRPRARRPRGRVLRAARPVGRGQDDDAARDRRAREARHRHRAPDRDRRDAAPRPPSATWRWCSSPTRCTRSRRRRRTSPRRCGRASCPRPRSTRRSSAWPSCCTSSSCSTASPAQMSGGEMQRVALGRALVRDPRAFLMDEPLTNLDLKLRVEMRTELTRIHRSLGRTFLYVTNDQVEAMSMADQVAVLRDGTVQQVGAPTEIYDRPANRWVGDVRRLAAHEPAPVHGQRAARGRRLVAAEPRASRVQRRPPGAARRALRGPVAATCATSRRRSTGTVYAVEPLGDRTLVDIEVGDQRIVVKAPPTASLRDRRAGPRVRRPRPRPPVRRRHGVGDRATMIDAPLPPVLQAGADPRARPAGRRRVARGARVRARRLAGHRAPRPRAALRRGAARARARRARARCPTRRPRIETGLERARARGGAREGRDRRCARASWSRTGRRSSSTRPRPAWRSRARWSCGRRPS